MSENLEMLLYYFSAFFIISFVIYLLRNTSFAKALANIVLFLAIYAGIIVFCYLFDGPLNNEEMENGVAVQNNFNGEAFVAQYISANPLLYAGFCILLTFILRIIYYNMLKIKQETVIDSNPSKEK